MRRPLILVVACWIVAACGSDTVTGAHLTLAQSYHLRSLDGVLLPIVTSGGATDSGTATRHGADSLEILVMLHDNGTNSTPRLGVIQVNDCRAQQIGSTVLLFTIYSLTPDTAFVSNDTLTVHSRSGGPLHVQVFVAP